MDLYLDYSIRGKLRQVHLQFVYNVQKLFTSAKKCDIIILIGIYSQKPNKKGEKIWKKFYLDFLLAYSH